MGSRRGRGMCEGLEGEGISRRGGEGGGRERNRLYIFVAPQFEGDMIGEGLCKLG